MLYILIWPLVAGCMVAQSWCTSLAHPPAGKPALGRPISSHKQNIAGVIIISSGRRGRENEIMRPWRGSPVLDLMHRDTPYACRGCTGRVDAIFLVGGIIAPPSPFLCTAALHPCTAAHHRQSCLHASPSMRPILHCLCLPFIPFARRKASMKWKLRLTTG